MRDEKSAKGNGEAVAFLFAGALGARAREWYSIGERERWHEV